MATIEPEARELLHNCGGVGPGWMNFWGGPDLAPIWFPAGHPPTCYPEYWQSVYFSLSPRKTRLPGKRRGGLAELLYLTCLFSELDEKDGRTWSDVETMDPQPSAIIRSGGGWHCYWFISPVWIDDTNREKLNQTQHAWTKLTRGDPGAPDISRVLRLPGSFNCKYNPPRKVEVILLDPSRRYDLRELAALLPEEEPQGGWKAQPGSAGVVSLTADPEKWLKQALEMAKPGNRNRLAFWLACQLRDDGLSQSEAQGVLERYQSRVDSSHDRYTLSEAKSTLKSAYRVAPREPAAKGTL